MNSNEELSRYYSRSVYDLMVVNAQEMNAITSTWESVWWFLIYRFHYSSGRRLWSFNRKHIMSQVWKKKLLFFRRLGRGRRQLTVESETVKNATLRGRGLTQLKSIDPDRPMKITVFNVAYLPCPVYSNSYPLLCLLRTWQQFMYRENRWKSMKINENQWCIWCSSSICFHWRLDPMLGTLTIEFGGFIDRSAQWNWIGWNASMTVDWVVEWNWRSMSDCYGTDLIGVKKNSVDDQGN